MASLNEGTLKPVGRLSQGEGLGCLVLVEEQVLKLVETCREMSQGALTVPKVADLLNIKQEVAYYLIRQGLLTSFTAAVGRRTVALVSRDELDVFRTRYVLARDLADFRKTTSRSLLSRLAAIGIFAIVNPNRDPCRQAIFERTPELEVLFPELRRHP